MLVDTTMGVGPRAALPGQVQAVVSDCSKIGGLRQLRLVAAELFDRF